MSGRNLIRDYTLRFWLPKEKFVLPGRMVHSLPMISADTSPGREWNAWMLYLPSGCPSAAAGEDAMVPAGQSGSPITPPGPWPWSGTVGAHMLNG